MLLGHTQTVHTDAVTTSYGQDAGTSQPPAVSNGTAQSICECWSPVRAGQHCRTNGALARVGPVPQNDPSFPLAISKTSWSVPCSSPCHCPQWGQAAAVCPPPVPLALPWAAAVSKQHPGAAVGSISHYADVSPTGLGRAPYARCHLVAGAGRGALFMFSTFPHRRELHQPHTAVLGLLRRADEGCEDIGLVRVENHHQV